jgi:asparagine synthase (glutamine-hydrolysing)
LLDLSAAANQPFQNENCSLVYNGEIYNFAQIRTRLRRDFNADFKTTSDTEVLFYSLIHNGIHETLRQINGMFAFAFYDKSNNELWLARDRLGIKPLYYTIQNGGFYWSSEVKALVKTLNLTPDPIKTFFSLNGIAEKSNDYTLFKDVFAVRAGSYLKIKAGAGEPEIFDYYQPLDDFEPDYYKELNDQSAAEVTAEFERLFVESVRGMIVADAPLGAFVSGGVDSSLISAVASRHYPNLKLFTANMVGKFSEYEEAKAMAQHIGAKLFDYRFEPKMMLRDWAEVTYFYETPIIVHTNAIPFSNVSRLANKLKVKAVLTGEGADELFLGYPRLLAERYNKFALLPVKIIKSPYRLIPGLENYLFPNQKQTTLEFANQLVQNFGAAAIDQSGFEKFNFMGTQERREQLLTIKMLGDHLVTLLHRNDRMGMMGSIEARFPFLDESLVKFAINLPVKYKIRKSLHFHNFKHPFLIDKWIVRKMAEKYLPKTLSSKKKIGFPMQGHKFVRLKDEFFKNGWVEEKLSLSAATQKIMLDSQDAYFIAKLASVDIFGRIFACGDSVEQVKNHILNNAEMVG